MFRGIAKFLRRMVAVFIVVTIAIVVVLRWLPPPISSFMLREQVLALLKSDSGYRLKYRWTPWAEISPWSKLAVVAAEDQRFANHLGFDLPAIAKALEQNNRGRKIRGASTITQQTAKNLFLYPGRNLLRKGFEVYFTVLLELLWPKQRILETYLNIAQFGAGIYGVSEASRVFFNKRPMDLNPREAALLAAVLPNPLRFRVDKTTPYVEARRKWILRQMLQLGGPGFLKNFQTVK